MKNLIDKITNKDRLIKLYGCEECDSEGLRIRCNAECGFRMAWPISCPRERAFKCEHLNNCPSCQGKGYIINRDSQVLDIVTSLMSFRNNYIPEMYCPGARFDLARALIKLIELTYDVNKVVINQNWSGYNGKSIDSEIGAIVALTINHLTINALNSLIDFCNHHNIDIWDSVNEILEGEG